MVPVFDPDAGVFIDPNPRDHPDPNDGEEDTSPLDPYSAQTKFFFGGCYLDPQINRYANNAFPAGRNTVLPGTRRGYMAFREIEESELNLPVRIEPGDSRPVLAANPGPYWVISQGAEANLP